VTPLPPLVRWGSQHALNLGDPARGFDDREDRPATPEHRERRRQEVTIVTSPGSEDAFSARRVIDMGCGVTVYPPETDGEPWRAVWVENGRRRFRQAAREAALAAKLAVVTGRLKADAPNMERTGGDLIAHYLNPDRLPVDREWSRKHAHTQRRLCERFAAPVIATPPASSDEARLTESAQRTL
jgi:hypothetical protein